MLGQAHEVLEADLGIVIESELGRLDRDLAVDPGGHDLVDRVDVVRRDLVRRGEVLEVLAEARIHRADPDGLERRRAPSASARVSPGMNRRTARRMNRMRGRRSFSHRFRAAHRKTRRITPPLMDAHVVIFDGTRPSV